MKQAASSKLTKNLQRRLRPFAQTFRTPLAHRQCQFKRWAIWSDLEPIFCYYLNEFELMTSKKAVHCTMSTLEPPFYYRFSRTKSARTACCGHPFYWHKTRLPRARRTNPNLLNKNKAETRFKAFHLLRCSSVAPAHLLDPSSHWQYLHLPFAQKSA
jgi:hypothetical protein